MHWMDKFYQFVTIKKPLVGLFILIALAAFCLFNVYKFRLDASSESLMLEGDDSLATYKQIKKEFTTDDFLIVTFEPANDLFTFGSISILQKFRDELSQIEGIASVTSILDVPLLQTPGLTLLNFSAKAPKIAEGNIALNEAKDALLQSPLYSEMLLSKDGKVTAIILTLAENTDASLLYDKKAGLLAKKKRSGGLTDIEQNALRTLNQQIRDVNIASTHSNEVIVKKVRSILKQYQANAKIRLGGPPMIVNDMLTYIQKDIVTFGVLVFLVLLAVLWWLFRRTVWVLIPIVCCALTTVTMMSLLGLLDWPVTVVSSNFVSLLVIITISLNIHLIVRYQDFLHANMPGASGLKQSIYLMATPCFYMILTTAVAFISLFISDIRPVIDFGKMMVLGLFIAFFITFMLFPIMIQLLHGDGSLESPESHNAKLLNIFAHIAHRVPKLIIVVAIILTLFAFFGISKLSVDNRFIDYFSEETEIYQGMSIIDDELGGTMPVDIVIESKNWYTTRGINKLEQIHRGLDAMPGIGKVVSFSTLMQISESLNNDVHLNSFLLQLLKQNFDGSVKEILVDPYMNASFTKAHFSLRLKEKETYQSRQTLFDDIKQFLVEDMNIAESNIQISGMGVLYENVLQSLFGSQIKTLGFVLLIIMATFLLLFRSISIALIAIVPNIVSIASVLGLMGLMGISLDIMTITIASISIGIAVDDTIHYIHRFKTEFESKKSYKETMYACHKSIGRAMLYTTLVIVVGFSVLSFSNFNPTIYFGLFTAFAMVIALLAALLLLPVLINWFKPFGVDHS